MVSDDREPFFCARQAALNLTTTFGFATKVLWLNESAPLRSSYLSLLYVRRRGRGPTTGAARRSTPK